MTSTLSRKKNKRRRGPKISREVKLGGPKDNQMLIYGNLQPTFDPREPPSLSTSGARN